jgi:hypothetical protein
MPTLSASDYTTFLKFKAAAATPIQPAIQTRDNVSVSQSVINANILASQAAQVVTPFRRSTLTPTISAATSTPVTEARTNIISSAVGGTTLITYTTSQPHGLTGTPTITVSGLTQNTLNVSPNFTAGAVTVTGESTFTRTVSTNTGSSTGTGSITNRVYYTTSVTNGLVANDVISITGLTTFNASSATVVAVPSATTFVLTSATTGTAETGKTGSITGLVYFTTGADHGLTAGTTNLTLTAITGTPAFNLTLFTIYRVPTTTTFIVQSSATGTAVTGQTGVLTLTTYNNTRSVLTSIGRVVAFPRVQLQSNPNALSTVSWTSGTSGSVGSLTSSRTNVPGGLPVGFKNSQGTYTRLPQNAGWIQGGRAMLSSGPKRF